MNRLRTAFIFAYGDRLAGMAVNLVTLMVTARLLTPKELGMAVIGLAIVGLVDVMREFGSSAFLVQTPVASPERVRTAFTVNLLLTILIAAALALGAGRIEAIFNAGGLSSFVYVSCLAMVLGPFTMPAFAMMRRDLDFTRLAGISAAISVIAGLATITLATCGASHMSFAWANLAAGVTNLAVCTWLRPMAFAYRPCLHEWREVAAYGVYESGRGFLYSLLESAPQLVLGRFSGVDAAGFFQRAQTLARLPERILLAGMAPALLPALAERARNGEALDRLYLRGVSYVTALIWPSLLFLLLFAEPIVLLTLGPQWSDAVPLVRIFAGAYALWINMNLTNPILIAIGRIRDTFVLAAMVVIPCTLVYALAAAHGMQAAAIVTCLVIGWFVAASLLVLRRHIPLDTAGLAGALRPSAIVASASGVGPFAVALAAHAMGTTSVLVLIPAVAAGLAGWLAGVHYTDHPVRREVRAVMVLAASAVERIRWYRRAGRAPASSRGEGV